MVDMPTRIAAEEYLESLSTNGVDYLFANPGTDFAPIVEAYARSAGTNRAMPKAMVIPHENAAVGMAHGFAMVTGRPQAVMLHTNVGTANGIAALINASRDRVPVLLTSGRTPITETGPSGTRNNYIHWAQEMFDQAGMLREVVKWDYEMRRGDQATLVVERALEIATSSPRGPVYLSLPREALGETVEVNATPRRARKVSMAPLPAPADIETLADWICAARKPMIITSGAGRYPGESAALAALADRFALPVIASTPRYYAISSRHPMYQGALASPMLKDADLVLVLESDVPWLPSREAPAASARVVQVGEDPLYAQLPMRGFPSDLTITAGLLPTLQALTKALEARAPDVAARHAELSARSAKLQAGWEAEVAAGKARGVINMAVFNDALRTIVDDQTVIVSEYSFRQDYCPLPVPASLFGLSSAGGLGWGFPAALGAKLAAPEKLVVAVLGDGAYMFANPVACHWVGVVHKLPVLVVLFNNMLYNAVRRSTLDMYGNGVASENDGRLMADLLPAPDFEKMMEVHGGHAERVETIADLGPALTRAANAVRQGKQAVVNVICSL